MNSPGHGFWIQTHSGIAFDLSAPLAAMVRLEDVAYSLARLCRFTGHCARHYSVSEHSRHVAQAVAEEHPEWALAALLHEVEEAYIGDLSSPLKALLRNNGGAALLRGIVEPIKAAAAIQFGLTPYTRSMYSRLRRVDVAQLEARDKAIKQADLRMLATERRDLMPELPDWGSSWFAATGYAPPVPYEWHLSPDDDRALWPELEVEAFERAFKEYGGAQ